MESRVAVLDPLPLYRRGVATSLRDLGLSADLPDDVWAWTARGDAPVVLLSLCAPADWQLLADLHAQRPQVSLVALIDEPDTSSYLRALGSGALCALPRASTAEALSQALGALMNGHVLLPTSVVRALVETRRLASGPEAAVPSQDELTWLRALATGSTIARLAEQAGYSEREMFRRLRVLYTKLSAPNRMEALTRARTLGWI